MKKCFLFFVIVLLLFSCATNKELERIETNVEEIEEETKEEVLENSGSLAPIENEEKDDEDLSSFPVLYSDGEFFDIKNEGEVINREEEKSEPKELKIEKEQVEEPEAESKKKSGSMSFIILDVFIVLALIIIFSTIGTMRKRKQSVSDYPLWEEKEEYSSLLDILSEEKNEEKKNF